VSRALVIAITVALSIITLAAALHAAQLWGLAGFSETVKDSTYDHLERGGDAFVIIGREQNSGALNGRAARWTAISALLGAATSIWGAVSSYFVHP
jgi:hypothetical protein